MFALGACHLGSFCGLRRSRQRGDMRSTERGARRLSNFFAGSKPSYVSSKVRDVWHEGSSACPRASFAGACACLGTRKAPFSRRNTCLARRKASLERGKSSFSWPSASFTCRKVSSSRSNTSLVHPKTSLTRPKTSFLGPGTCFSVIPTFVERIGVGQRIKGGEAGRGRTLLPESTLGGAGGADGRSS